MSSSCASSASSSVDEDEMITSQTNQKVVAIVKPKKSAAKSKTLAPMVILFNTSSTRYHVVRDAALAMPGWAIEDDGRRDVPRRYWKESDCKQFKERQKARVPMTTNTSGSSLKTTPRIPATRPTPPPSATTVGLTRRSSSSSSKMSGKAVSGNPKPEKISALKSSVVRNEENNDDSSVDLDAENDLLWGDEPDLSKHSKQHFAAKMAKISQYQRKVSKKSKPSKMTPVGDHSPEDNDIEEGLGMSIRQEEFVLKKLSITSGKGYDPAKHCSVFWTDMSVLPARVSSLKCWQRLNHFPEMHLIARKMNLFQRLGKISNAYQHIFPKSFFDFFPRSWSSKTERKQLEEYMAELQSKNKVKTFLMKPNTGCQGRGIILTRNPVAEMSNIKSRHVDSFSGAKSKDKEKDSGHGSRTYDPLQDYTIQLYIHRPLLIDGRKFDMRVYVLILSLNNPCPHIFIHKEGLVRIAAQLYQKPTPSNYKKSTMHLTNYAVNKKEVKESFLSEEAKPNESSTVDDSSQGDIGLKRDFSFLQKFVDTNCQRWVNQITNDSEDLEDPLNEAMGTEENGGQTSTSNDGLVKTKITENEPVICKDGRSDIGNLDLPPACKGITPFHALLQRVDRAVVLTILSALPQLLQAMQSCSMGYLTPQAGFRTATGYPNEISTKSANLKISACADGRQCFELLGFDILVTDSGRTHVLEVNHSPSLFCDSALDQRIKQRVLTDVFTLLHPTLMDVSKTSATSSPSADERYAKHVSVSNTKTQTKVTKSFQKVEFRQVHPVPNSISETEVKRGYPFGASPFLFHRSDAPSNAVFFTSSEDQSFSPFISVSIDHRIDEMESFIVSTETSINTLKLFSCYDPHATSLPLDYCYNNKEYAMWCRHMYDTVMVATGVWQGYQRRHPMTSGDGQRIPNLPQGSAISAVAVGRHLKTATMNSNPDSEDDRREQTDETRRSMFDNRPRLETHTNTAKYQPKK